MNDTTIDQKLRLVQQVRSRYHENQYDLSNRERLLYGRTSRRMGSETASPYDSFQDPYEEEGTWGYGNRPAGSPFSNGMSSFHWKIRFVMALLLLAAIIMMDRNHINVAGITTEKIFEMISADYEEEIEAWMETMSQQRNEP